jgi:hypothetical protein
VSQDRVYGHTRSGKPITDKEIETLAAEADAGYDVDTLLARSAKRERIPSNPWASTSRRSATSSRKSPL